MPVTLRTLRRFALLAAALLLVSGALVACGSGSDDDSSTSGGASTSAQSSDSGGGVAATARALSAVASGGGLGFSRRTLAARAGDVTIRLANGADDRFPHAIAIEGNGVDEDGEVVQPGGSSSVTVRLKPGRYTFYCPVGDHEKDGMKGTLTVS